MSGLIKNILILFLILTIGAWIFTVARSCEKQEPTVIENPISDADAEGETIVEDDLYDDELDGEGDGETAGEGNGEGDLSETIGDELDDLVDENDELDDLKEELDGEADSNAEEAREESSSTASTSSRSGLSYEPHLVIAGSYLSEVNAKILVNKLKKAGYSDAEVVVFDFSQYHTVCAGRYASSNKAHSTKRKIIDGGLAPEAYVHTKRPRKK